MIKAATQKVAAFFLDVRICISILLDETFLRHKFENLCWHRDLPDPSRTSSPYSFLSKIFIQKVLNLYNGQQTFMDSSQGG
jgi:hypothetical protein